MIKSFPEFTEINLEIQNEIVNFTKRFDLYADFSFVNLFSWNIDSQAGAAWLNKNLVIRLPDYIYGGEHIYSILGDNLIDESLEMLFKHVERLDLVPEIVIWSMKNPEKYAKAEDRDSFDYLYKVDQLSKFSGLKLKNKRQKVNQTLRHFGSRLTFETVKSVKYELKAEMIHVLKRWQEQTPQPAEHTRLEALALKRLLDNFENFDLQVTTVRLDDKLEGFSINEIINQHVSICHFEKSIVKEHNGMYAVLIKEAAKSIYGKSEIVNWEQDLGIPGLKHIKRSYAPLKFYKKYWIINGNNGF